MIRELQLLFMWSNYCGMVYSYHIEALGSLPSARSLECTRVLQYGIV